MKKIPRVVHGYRNQLLGRLLSTQMDGIKPHLEVIDVQPRELIYDPHTPFGAVYFPDTAVGSIVTVLDQGVEAEIATVGYEGMLGLPVFLGARTSPGKSFWQVSGKAYRLPASVLRQETKGGGALAEALHLYTQALFVQIAQSAACNRLHPVDERCCRWLLMTHDRVEGDEFELTHEFLSQMLGVRRPGVSTVIRLLIKAGLVDYSRGRMRILDRAGLESSACECYRSVREEFERLIG